MDREVLEEIINNTKLTEGYLTLARDIEVMEPKSPEDIYKVWTFDGLCGAGIRFLTNGSDGFILLAKYVIQSSMSFLPQLHDLLPCFVLGTLAWWSC